MGKRADVVLIKNDLSPTLFLVLNPYGHIALQANRGDVRTVLVDGRVAKHEGRLVEDLAAARAEIADPVSYLRSTRGEEVWAQGMNPDVPPTKVLDNPYTHTEFRTADTHRSGADRRGMETLGSR